MKIQVMAVPLLLLLILGEFSLEVLARSKHHSGKNLYIRRSGHHKAHHRTKDKLKPRHKYYSNTWAVHFHPPHRDVAERITKKHGFEILGQVSVCNPSKRAIFLLLALKHHFNLKNTG